MISKLREAASDARLKAGVWLRERKERAEARRAQAALESHHGHGRFFLLHVPAIATICAAIVEWYWAILFCIEATGHIDWNYETSFGAGAAAASAWNFAFSTHWPVFVGLVCATIPIVMLSMVWLPVQFAMRGAGRWRRGTVIFVGVLANILVIVSGTVVMNYNRQDQVREALSIEQQAGQNRAAIEAQIAAVNGDLERLTDRRINNEYAATAANVGAAAYRAQYMSEEALARSPAARRDIIVRALGAAERADALRAERAGLFQQLAAAPTEAAVAANVEDTVGRELNTFAQYVEVWRPPFIAVLCTLVGIFGAWWVLALIQGINPKDVMRSGWAPEDHRIEDLREEEPVVPQPAVAPRQRRKVYNTETGKEEVFIQPKGYWRSTGKKTKHADGRDGELMEFMPEVPPDETGVSQDGGGRSGSAAAEQVDEAVAVDTPPASLPVEESLPADDAQAEESPADVLPADQPDSPDVDYTDEELKALGLAATDEASGADEDAKADQEAEESDEQVAAEEAAESADDQADAQGEVSLGEDHDTPQREEPETREDRLIAAE